MTSAGRLAPSGHAACARWAARPALTHRGRTWSYAEVGAQVRALAAAYLELGVGPGDRVVCQLPTCPEHLLAACAAWVVGAVHVGADKDLTGPELSALVGRTQAAAVVLQPPADVDDPASTLRADHPTTTVIVHGRPAGPGEQRLSRLLSAGGTVEPTPPRGGDEPDLLLLTSGTTGRPKAVVETLPALWAKMQFFADALRPTPDDVHLLYLPLSHAFGLKLSLMALASGGRLVLLDRFSPDEALRLVGDERVTILPGSPTHLNLLVRAFAAARHRVDSLRWAVSAAAPLPPEVLDGLYDRLGVELLFVYGCSEGFLTRTTERDDIRRRSVGRTVFRGPPDSPPDGTVAVVDPDGDRRLPVGQIGEIVFGASRPVRYWDEPAVATDGRYRSGDLGWIDGDGRLFVSGRLKDLINRGGLKVAPAEVEAVLARHPAVADCAVVASPDPILGEAICACVVPAGPQRPSLADLRTFLGASLARHKLPDELCLPAAIPRNRLGKVDRAALTAVAADLPRQRLRPAPKGGAAAAPAPVSEGS